MRFTEPSYQAFPQECSICDMCGHNATSHAAFMEAYPSIADEKVKSWLVGEGKIHHGCCWCRSYKSVYCHENKPRKRQRAEA